MRLKSEKQKRRRRTKMHSLSLKVFPDLPVRRGRGAAESEVGSRRFGLSFGDGSARGCRIVAASASERNSNGGGGSSRSPSSTPTPSASSLLTRSQTYALLKQKMEVAAKSEVRLLSLSLCLFLFLSLSLPYGPVFSAINESRRMISNGFWLFEVVGL